MKQTLLILIGLSTLSLADFTRSGDIVTDNATKRQWQDDATAASTSLTWQAAIDHCEALTLGDHSDWRLPNIRELKSITDKSKSNPAIFSAFQNTVSNGYWSSTTFAGSARFAWVVNFNFGNGSSSHKGSGNYVRCVR